MAEVNFWSERAANLNSIHEQLSGEKIQKVVKILELAKSAYFPAFEGLYSEVELARTEANDNVKVRVGWGCIHTMLQEGVNDGHMSAYFILTDPLPPRSS